MAQSTWNGGAGPVGKPKAPVKKAPSPKLIRGALAGLVVALLAGGACWFLTRPAPPPEKKPVPTVKHHEDVERLPLPSFHFERNHTICENRRQMSFGKLVVCFRVYGLCGGMCLC